MTEFLHLQGAEEITRASVRMKEAADTMRAAAEQMEHVHFQHRQFLEDWLSRFEQILAPTTAGIDDGRK